MRWILLDLALALVSLAVLAVLVLGLWRKVKALSAAVAAAEERIGAATAALEAAQLDGPLGAVPELEDRPGAADGGLVPPAGSAAARRAVPRSGSWG